jgi:hypothetical protein
MLSNSLSAELCNIVGVANTFIDVSTAILIVGFYYKLMALRLPLFSFVTRRMNSVLAHLAERYFFIVFSVLWGSLVAVWGILSATQEPTGALFASQLGWCQLKFREDGHLTSVFSWGVAFPAIMQLSLAVASFVSLRCFVGSSMEHVTIGKYWPVYVRWCAIIVFNSVAYAVAAIGLANDEKQWGLMLEMFIWPFAGVAYAASFIFTEQLVKYFRHDETDNGFSSSISALLATEVSGLHADLVGASGLEESDTLVSRNSSKPRGSMPGVQVRSTGSRQSHN